MTVEVCRRFDLLDELLGILHLPLYTFSNFLQKYRVLKIFRIRCLLSIEVVVQKILRTCNYWKSVNYFYVTVHIPLWFPRSGVGTLFSPKLR